MKIERENVTTERRMDQAPSHVSGLGRLPWTRESFSNLPHAPGHLIRSSVHPFIRSPFTETSTIAMKSSLKGAESSVEKRQTEAAAKDRGSTN